MFHSARKVDHYAGSGIGVRRHSTLMNQPEVSQKLQRRESVLRQGASHGKGIMSKFRPSANVGGDQNDAPPPPPYSAQSSGPSFSTILASTLENMEKVVSGDGRTSSDALHTEALRMLWEADLDKMQSVWKLNPEVIGPLRTMSCAAGSL